MSKMIQSLEDELKSLKAKVATSKTTLRTLQVSEANLKNSTAQALSEIFQLRKAANSCSKKLKCGRNK
jgi:predicted transcriptional regulator YheO